MITTFKLDPCVTPPTCREEGCELRAVQQVIDDAKRGTKEYCSYRCETHKIRDLRTYYSPSFKATMNSLFPPTAETVPLLFF